MDEQSINIRVSLQDDATAKLEANRVAFAQYQSEFNSSLSQLNSGMVNSGVATTALTEDTVNASDAIDEADQKTKGFANTMHAFAEFYAGSRILGTLFNDVKAASKAFDDWQIGVEKVNAVLKSTKDVSGETSAQAQDLAQSLSLVTRFSDDVTLSGEAIALTFTNIGADIFPQVIKTAQDMSTVMGTNLDQSIKEIGKALQDPVHEATNLRREGVNLSDQMKKQIDDFVKSGQAAKAQALILQELQREFGGAASAAGSTMGGQMVILQQRFQNISQTIGEFISTALTPIIRLVGEFTDKHQSLVVAIVGSLAAFALITGAVLTISGALGLATIAASSLNIALLPLIVTAAALAAIVGGSLYLSMTTGRDILKELKTWFDSNSISAEITRAAVKNLTDDFGLIWKVIQEQLIPSFKRLWEQLGPVLKPVLEGIAAIIGVTLYLGFKAIIIVIESVITVVQKLTDALTSALSLMSKFANAAANSSIGKSISGGISTIKNDIEGLFRADGGPVSSNRPYIVGERGPELFIPPSSGTIIPNNALSKGGGNITVTVNVSNLHTNNGGNDISNLGTQLGMLVRQAHNGI